MGAASLGREERGGGGPGLRQATVFVIRRLAKMMLL